MSTVTDTTSTTSTTTTTTSTTSSATLDQDAFLTLLVAQLENQDPLDPDDPSDFTSQLAQYSQLEQLFTVNDYLDDISTSNTNADTLSTLETIGKDVVYEASEIDYTGDSGMGIGYTLDDSSAESVVITIEQDGTVVRTIDATDMTTGTHFVEWDGLDDEGNTVEPGTYTITATAADSSGETTDLTTSVKAEVTGVDLASSTLTTEAGEINLFSITAVYDASDSDSTTEES